jgi:hypothetical protein
MMKKLTILVGAAAIALGACGSKKDGAKKDDKSGSAQASGDPAAPSTKPAEPTAPAAPAKAKSCAEYGGTGKGSFDDMCKLKGVSPIEAVVTSDYKDDFGTSRRDVKLTNKMDHDVTFGSISMYYYDKDGKALTLKADDGHDIGTSMEGSSADLLTVSAGQTADISFGVKKELEPAGTAKVEVEVTAWGWNGPDGHPDGGMFFTPHAEMGDLDGSKRPMGGWTGAPAK